MMQTALRLGGALFSFRGLYAGFGTKNGFAGKKRSAY